MSVIVTLSILGLSYLFISERLIGIDLAWIIGEIMICGVYLIVIKDAD